MKKNYSFILILILYVSQSFGQAFVNVDVGFAEFIYFPTTGALQVSGSLPIIPGVFKIGYLQTLVEGNIEGNVTYRIEKQVEREKLTIVFKDPIEGKEYHYDFKEGMTFKIESNGQNSTIIYRTSNRTYIVADLSKSYDVKIIVSQNNQITEKREYTKQKKVKIESYPSNATIFLNGSKVGQTPLNIFVSNENNSILIEKSGYRDYKFSVQKSSNKDSYYLKLSPFIPELTLKTTPSGATIFVDGENTFKVSPNTVSLQEGMHTIKVIKEGYHPLTEKLNIYNDSERNYTLTKSHFFTAGIIIGKSAGGAEMAYCKNTKIFYGAGLMFYTINESKNDEINIVDREYSIFDDVTITEQSVVTDYARVFLKIGYPFKPGIFYLTLNGGLGIAGNSPVYKVNQELSIDGEDFQPNDLIAYQLTVNDPPDTFYEPTGGIGLSLMMYNYIMVNIDANYNNSLKSHFTFSFLVNMFNMSKIH